MFVVRMTGAGTGPSTIRSGKVVVAWRPPSAVVPATADVFVVVRWITVSRISQLSVFGNVAAGTMTVPDATVSPPAMPGKGEANAVWPWRMIRTTTGSVFAPATVQARVWFWPNTTC